MCPLDQIKVSIIIIIITNKQIIVKSQSFHYDMTTIKQNVTFMILLHMTMFKKSTYFVHSVS